MVKKMATFSRASTGMRLVFISSMCIHLVSVDMYPFDFQERESLSWYSIEWAVGMECGPTPGVGIGPEHPND